MARVENVLLVDLPSWVEARVKEVGPHLRRAARATAHRGRLEVLKTIKATRPHPPVDRGAYRASWQVEVEKDGATLFSDAPHAAFIERGTRPHTPPFAPILAWVKRKKLAKGATTVVRGAVEAKLDEFEREIMVARAIQRAIARRGTRPLRVLERTLPAIARILEEEVEKALAAWESGSKGKGGAGE